MPFSHVTFQALEHPSADVAHFRLVVGLPVAVTVDLGQESFRAQLTQELSLSRMDPLGVVVQPGLAGELGVADAAHVSADVLVRCLDVVLQHVLQVVVFVAELALEGSRVYVLHLDVLSEAVVGSEVLFAVLALVVVLQDFRVAVKFQNVCSQCSLGLKHFRALLAGDLLKLQVHQLDVDPAMDLVVEDLEADLTLVGSVLFENTFRFFLPRLSLHFLIRNVTFGLLHLGDRFDVLLWLSLHFFNGTQ